MRNILGTKKFLLGTSASLVAANLGYRYTSTVEGKDQFASHTSEQHSQPMRCLSGMHEPFFADLSPEQKLFLDKNFAEYKRFLQLTPETFRQSVAIQTPVTILPISRCPLSQSQLQEVTKSTPPLTIVVGGAPALLSSANESGVLYINDFRQLSQADSSAWTLEYDSVAQRPVTFDPMVFMGDQFRRVLYPETLRKAEKNGFFSWRSFDWVAWMKNWSALTDFKLVMDGFRNRSLLSESELDSLGKERAQRCKANEKFLEDLNSNMKSKLLLFGRRSLLIYTRNREEYESAREMRKVLLKEGRQMQKMTQYHVDIKYGYEPKNMSLAVEKGYVRYIHPNFQQRVADYMQSRGSTVVDGVVTAVYTDDPKGQGFVEYTLNGNDTTRNKILVPFSKLILSVGNQDILDQGGKCIVASICSRAVAGLAVVYLKKGRKMPASIVIGSSNRVTNIAGPVRVNRSGQDFDSYLVRMTCGACLTPKCNSTNKFDYDSVAATGLVASMRKWLSCDVDVLSVWGSNRQLTQFGEMRWFEGVPAAEGVSLKDIGTIRPKIENINGIIVQIGSGGSGIAQGPSQPPLEDTKRNK